MGVPESKIAGLGMVALLVIAAVASPVGVADLSSGETAGNTLDSGDWATFRYNASNTGHHPYTKPPAKNQMLAWELPRNDSIRSSPIVVDGTVYVGSSTHGRLYALDAETGNEKWRFDVSGAVRSPTYATGTVYFGTSDGVLYAVDATTGAERWNRTIGARIDGSPTLVSGTIFVTATNDSTSGNIYALDGDTGERIWRHHVDGYANATPAFGSGTVYASASGNVTAIDAWNGTVRWSTSVGINGNLTAPTVGPERVWVGTYDPANNSGGLYALVHHDDGIINHNGEVTWEYRRSSRIGGPPALARDRIYATFSDELLAIKTSNGNKAWNAFPSATLTTGPVVAEKTVFVGTTSGPMAIDAEENPTSGASTTLGETRWHRVMDGSGSEPRGNVRSAPVVVNNSMYVGFARDYNSLYKLTGEDYNHNPVARFTVKPKHPAVGEYVLLNATKSYDVDGTITKYEWDTTGVNYIETTGRVTTYRYTESGYKDVNIDLTDDEGGMGFEGIDGIDVGGYTNFSAVNYTVSDTSPLVGEPVSVNATVENAGTGDGWMNVTLYHEGVPALEKTVLVLRGGNTTNVSFDFSYTEPGNYSLTVESRPQTAVTVRDETPPDAPPSVSTPNWANETAEVSWMAASDNVEVDHYEVQVDDGAWQNVTGTDATLTNLTNGTHEVSVRAVDTVGNVGPATNETLRVDTVAPSALNVTVPDGWVGSGATVSWGDVTDDESGFSYYEVRYDDGAWQWTTQENDNVYSSTSASVDVSVRGVDRAGNRGPVTTETVRIDADEPDLGVSLSTSSSRDDATLTVNVTDPESGLDPGNVTVVVDGDSVSENLSVVGDSVVYVGNFSKGTHHINVTATDNRSNTVRRNMTLDTGFDGGGSGGSGGSGSGGGGGADVPPPTVIVKVVEKGEAHLRAKVTNARADDPGEVSLSGLETDSMTFSELTVTPESTSAESRFFVDATVASAPSVSSLPSDESLGFLRTELTYINDDDLASATVRFRVPADGISPEEVTAYHYRDGSWHALETSFVGEQSGKYTFRASSSGIGLFGVGVTQLADQTTTAGATTAKTTTGTTDATTEGALENSSETATRAPSEGSSESTPGFGPVVALAALVVALVIGGRRE